MATIFAAAIITGSALVARGHWRCHLAGVFACVFQEMSWRLHCAPNIHLGIKNFDLFELNNAPQTLHILRVAFQRWAE